MTKPLTDSDPREVGGVKLEGRLGEGGMGTVYLGRTASGEPRAVKVLKPELSNSQELRNRLKREAEVLERLRGDRSASVFEVNSTAERPYLIMEFVRGESLNDYIAKQGKLSGVLAWAVMEALLEAMEMFHDQDITHRDLKPSNVMLGDDGVKIIDFGISGLVGSSLTEVGTTPATMLWSSPEQMSGKSVGKPSDIFNLGMLFCYAWSGRHPFEAPKSDAMMFRLMNSEPNLEGVPTRLHQMILSCLKKEPSERPSVAQLRGLMGNISRSGSGSNSGSMGAGASSQPTGTVLVDMERHMESRRVGKSDTPTTRLTNPKFLVGIAVAVVLVISGIAIFGRGSSSSEDLITQDSSSVVPTLAGEETARVKTFDNFILLPRDSVPGIYLPETLQIDLSEEQRHLRNGANRVFELQWMAINCRRNQPEQPIQVQLDVRSANQSLRLDRAREIVIEHVSQVLRIRNRKLQIRAAPVQFTTGRFPDPIVSAISSDALAEQRNTTLYEQFGSTTGIRPIRIVFSPLSTSDLDFYVQDLAKAREEEGWKLVGSNLPLGYVVDFGWSIAATRKLGWKGPKVIDAAAVTVAREIWETASDEELLLVMARALLLGLGASLDRASSSLLSVSNDNRFTKLEYSFNESDLDLIGSLGLEDNPPCR